jgi:hypothetical protein
MSEEKIKDNNIFYIMAKLERFGHPKLPFAIIKEKQSYIVGHKRKRFSDGSEYLDKACKIVYVKCSGCWKLYWMRVDLKWHLYEEYSSLDELLEVVKKDPDGCFWG